MKGAGAYLQETAAVEGGAVALVTGEAITRVIPVQPDHQAVPVDFGHDGGAGNGKTELVPPDESLLGEGDLGKLDAVDENELRRDSKGLKRLLHGQARGRQDTYPVYLF